MEWKQDNKKIEVRRCRIFCLRSFFYAKLKKMRTESRQCFNRKLARALTRFKACSHTNGAEEITQSPKPKKKKTHYAARPWGHGTKRATPPPFLSASPYLPPSVPLSSLSSNRNPWDEGPPGNHGYRDWVPLSAISCKTLYARMQVPDDLAVKCNCFRENKKEQNSFKLTEVYKHCFPALTSVDGVLLTHSWIPIAASYTTSQFKTLQL